MIVPLVSSLDGNNGDDSMIEAVTILAATHPTCVAPDHHPLWRCRGNASAGCIVVFMLTAGSYLPILLGARTRAVQTSRSHDQFITATTGNPVRHLAFLLLAFTSLVVWAELKLSGQTLQQHGGEKLNGFINPPLLS